MNVLNQLNNVLVHVVLLNGKVITIVMMKTTIVDVNLMGEIAVEKMSTQVIAKNVNVLKFECII